MMRIPLLLFLLINLNSYSQKSDSIKAFSNTSTNRYFSIQYDNDYFSATDYYYTQGVRFEFIAPFLKHSPLSKLLLSLGKSSTNYYGLAPVQDCFTPTSIRRDTVFTGDRPFAAYAYLGSFRISNDEENLERLTTQIDMGVLGPCAHCKETQENIHAAIGDIQPLGWQFQIKGDVLLNYSARYEFGTDYQWKHFDFIGFADAKAGTLYDNFGGGFTTRMGRINPYFSSLGSAKISSKQGTKGFRNQFYLYTRSEASTVIYNAALQGGLFNRTSIYTIAPSEMQRIVLSQFIGAVIVLHNFRIEYAQAFLGREFKNGLPHGWGHINLTTCF